MQYLLMIHGDEKAMQAALARSKGSDARGLWRLYQGDIRRRRGQLPAQRLHPTSTATTVRVKNGKTQVLNGPYAEVKEQLGGYLLIDAPDLDAAISWAARCPGAKHGAIEVRPIWEM